LPADQVAGNRVWPTDLRSDGRSVYWLESRPAEAGRVVLVRWQDGTTTDHSPAGVSIRSRVHEYGGGAVCLVPAQGEGTFAYVDQADQRVWLRQGDPAGAQQVRPLSADAPAGQTWQHGGLVATPDGRFVLAVREVRHAQGGHGPVEHCIVALGASADRDTDTDEPIESVLVSGHDFFGAPAVSADCGKVAVVCWDHPDMPWDASHLIVQPVIAARDPVTHRPVLTPEGEQWLADGGVDESLGQPQWRPDGTLQFVSDRAGWWQPYLHAGEDDGSAPRRLTDVEAEFHGPDWNLGQHTMAMTPDGLVARMTHQGRDALVVLDPGQPAAEPALIEQPCVNISSVCRHGDGDGDGIAWIGATPDAPASVWLLTDTATPTQLRVSAAPVLTPADISLAQTFELEGRGGRPVHGLLYRPTLRDTTGPQDEAPPLIVWCHGGPTTATQPNYDPMVQFFTTRGFAVAAVDYAGSTGYGRAYRNSLRGLWGMADSEDCLDAARYLAASHAIDGSRMAVRGTSAGGMTALNAPAAGEGFAACVTMFAVTDLLVLPEVSHDFEAHYTDSLIGPLPAFESAYRERSPVHRAAAMRGAVLLMHGTDDQVVPLSQAEALHEALLDAGRTCELRIFEGEGHGFRRAETVTAALEAELDFYRTHLAL
jgi:dipeptidyl aminopeptidase/acylaminoacyl peptidase